MTTAELQRAAQILEEEGQSLIDCHTRGGNGTAWDDDPVSRQVKAEAEEMLDLSKKLRVLTQTHRAGNLRG